MVITVRNWVLGVTPQINVLFEVLLSLLDASCVHAFLLGFRDKNSCVKNTSANAYVSYLVLS